MITLNNEDTTKLFIYKNRLESIPKRYKTRTLHKWWCLNCRKEIYLRYGLESIVNIFCDDEELGCKEHLKKPTIIQYQYFKKLKDEQLKLFESIK